MKNDTRKYYFQIGKGGVGKSTTSVLTAMQAARSGRKVLLVSLDPAHNLADIFDMDIPAEPIAPIKNLQTAQADVDAWVADYLRGIEHQMRRSYTYQTAFNLEKHLGVIKHSPGIEEYALLLAFRHYRNLGSDRDIMVFDMPPTALSTKFFHLPTLSLLWIDQLMQLRAEILNKKEIITKIHVGKKEIEQDKITCKLSEQEQFFRELDQLFRNREACNINVVVNPDKLSFAEAERVAVILGNIEIHPAGVIMNKVAPGSSWDESSALLNEHIVHQLPLSKTPLIGTKVLEEYLEKNSDNFTFMDRS